MVEFSTFKHEYKNSAFFHSVPRSKDYRVFVNGEEVPVYTCRTSAYPFNRWWPGHQRPVSQTDETSFVNLVSDEEIEVAVEPLTKTACERIMIKPYAKGIRHEKKGDHIIFKLIENGGYLFELDDYHGMLYIFNNKPCPCDSPEKVTYYFGKGVHFAGKITLRSNESIYLDKDALVYGCVYAENSENIHVFGNGIFDDGTEERVSEHCYEAYANGNIKLYDCKNLRIEGVGFTNSAIWCVNLFHCLDAEINGINVFGQWRYNTDGVDIVNCRNVTVKNSFIHSFDDTVTIKGIDRYAYESNTGILVENCVLICDWGKTMEIGLETECREYSNIKFKDCHVIRGGHTACDIQNGDCATVHDITFEDISLELESFYTKYQLQESDEQVYERKDITEVPYLLMVKNPRFRDAYSFLGVGTGDVSMKGTPDYAAVRRVIVKNVNIYADEGIAAKGTAATARVVIKNQIPTSEFADISIENVCINGVRISAEDMSILTEGCDGTVLSVK